MTKAEKQEMYEHYKSELKRVKEMRKSGTKGYIETVSYFQWLKDGVPMIG